MITWLASLIALLWLISSSLWVGIAIGEKFEKEAVEASYVSASYW